MSNMDFNKDFNPTSAILAMGIQHIETENELFVQQMETALEFSSEAYEYSHKAHDKKIESAWRMAVAEGVQAGAQLASGGTNLYGGMKMNVERKNAMNDLTETRTVQTDPNGNANARPSVGSQSERQSVSSRDSNATDVSVPNQAQNDNARSSVGNQRDRTSVESRYSVDSDDSNQSQPQNDNLPDNVNANRQQANADDAMNDSALEQTQVAVGGSTEFQNEFNRLENKIGGLKAQRRDLAETNVRVEQQNGGQPVDKKLSEVSDTEYNNWKTRRDDLEQRASSGQDIGDDARIEQRELNEKIELYEDFKAADKEIGESLGKQNTLVTTERNQIMTATQMRTGTMQMRYNGLSEVTRGIMGLIAAPMKAMATAVGVEGDHYNTEAEWCKERGSAQRSLAEQALSNSKEVIQSINEAYQVKQSAIQKLSTVQA